MVRVTGVFAVLAALPVAASAQVIRQPSPRLEMDHELVDPVGLQIGASAGLAVLDQEAFESLGPGFVGHLFVASKFGIVDEVRVGAALGTSPEELRSDWVTTVSLYLETRFATEILGADFRAGPRVAWMHMSREILATDRHRGFGGGGAAGVSLPLSSRIDAKVGTTITLFLFGPSNFDDNRYPPDADNQSYGLVYELRLGISWHLKQAGQV